MRLELKVSVELSPTDAAMFADYLNENGQTEEQLASRVIEGEVHRIVIDRKKDVGQILALKGGIDESLRIESAKLAEARKSPW